MSRGRQSENEKRKQSFKHINLRRKSKQRWCNNFFYDFLFCCATFTDICVCVSMAAIRGRGSSFMVRGGVGARGIEVANL